MDIMPFRRVLTNIAVAFGLGLLVSLGATIRCSSNVLGFFLVCVTVAICSMIFCGSMELRVLPEDPMHEVTGMVGILGIVPLVSMMLYHIKESVILTVVSLVLGTAGYLGLYIDLRRNNIRPISYGRQYISRLVNS